MSIQRQILDIESIMEDGRSVVDILIYELREARRESKEELRELRKDLRRLNETVTTLKVKFGLISGLFGIIGGTIGKTVFDFLNIKH